MSESQQICLTINKTGRGRPKLAVSKSKILGVRMLSEEKSVIEAIAKARGLKPSEWARNVLLNCARTDLKGPVFSPND
jgi:hypothetical protein